MQLRKRFLAFFLALALVLPVTLLLSPALPVVAQTSSDLYGTGSADELSILKLLDMALNRGGMSMSPDTLKAYLDYWWTQVVSDFNTLVADADSTITTTDAMVDYLTAAVADPTKADGLNMAQVAVKYATFCASMGNKTLSDFITLVRQPGTFRQFLLSYVTDQDGNIAGTVNNKLIASGKYKVSSDLVNMVRKAADLYIREYEGYWLVPTNKVSDIVPNLFNNKESYDLFLETVKYNLNHGTFGYSVASSYVRMADFTDLIFVASSVTEYGSGRGFGVNIYDSNWMSQSVKFYCSSSGSIKYDELTDTAVLNSYKSATYYPGFIYISGSTSKPYSIPCTFFTDDGQPFKVWKSLDSYKSYSVGKSNIYYTSGYGSYDDTADNAVEFPGSYYNSTTTSYSHDTIQQHIDNSSVVDESTVNNIVNNYITNNYYGSGNGSSGSGSNEGNWWDIGSGISSFIEGIASLLDFLLLLLGDLIGVISEFLADLLVVLGQLASVSTGFGDLLKALFGFLPDDCISLIISGIGLMVAVGVIKMVKR